MNIYYCTIRGEPVDKYCGQCHRTECIVLKKIKFNSAIQKLDKKEKEGKK